MIPKKSPKANLEKRRYAFFQIGLIISGGLCLAAFEYVSANDVSPYLNNDQTKVYLSPEPPVEEIIMKDKVKPKPVKLVDFDNLDSIHQVNKIVHTVTGTEVDTNAIDDIVMIDSIPGFLTGGITKPIVDSVFSDLDVDKAPEFIGGEAAMAKWIVDHIDIPEYRMSNGGTVYVGFVVGKDGKIDKVNIVRGIEEPIDDAAIDVVKDMPKWIPGEVKGKPVNVRFILPLRIKLD